MISSVASLNVLPSDLENSLYEEWKNSSPDDRDTVEKRLIRSLTMHAHRVAYMVLHSTSPDIVDDITFSVFADIQSFRGESKFSTWIHRALLNCCHNIQRSRRRKKETSLTGAPASSLEVFNDPDQRLLLQQLIGPLKDLDKQIIQLYLEGNTAAEIGSKLAISKASAEQRLWRTIGEMRESCKVPQ